MAVGQRSQSASEPDTPTDVPPDTDSWHHMASRGGLELTLGCPPHAGFKPRPEDWKTRLARPNVMTAVAHVTEVLRSGRWRILVAAKQNGPEKCSLYADQG